METAERTDESPTEGNDSPTRGEISRQLRETKRERLAAEARRDALEAELAELRGGGDRFARASAENAELKAQLAKMTTDRRQGALLERVQAETGLDRPVLGALLREAHAADVDSFDLAPESVTDHDVRDAVRALRTFAPKLFDSPGDPPSGRPRNRPGPAPTPHLGGVPDDRRLDDGERWRRRAQDATDPLARERARLQFTGRGRGSTSDDVPDSLLRRPSTEQAAAHRARVGEHVDRSRDEWRERAASTSRRRR